MKNMRNYTSKGIKSREKSLIRGVSVRGARAPKLYHVPGLRPGRKVKSKSIDTVVDTQRDFSILPGLSKAATLAFLTLYTINPILGVTACSSGGSGGGNGGGYEEPADDDTYQDDDSSPGDDTSPIDDDSGDDDSSTSTTVPTTTSTTTTTQTPTFSVSGNVRDILNSSLYLEGATVTIGGRPVNTNAEGSFTLDGFGSGDYTISISKSGYITYGAGKVRVNQSFADDGKLENILLEVIPDSFDMDFFNECCRSYGATQRIADEDLSAWKGYLDLNPAVWSGIEPNGTMIDYATQVMNEWCARTEGKFCPEIDEGITPPDYGTPKITIFYWDDSSGGGGHDEYMEGNKITSSYAEVNTSEALGTYRHELWQAVGVRNDSNLAPSIFNDPYTRDDYSQVDKDSIDLLYSRPIGNTSPDNNPSDYIVNEAQLFSKF